MARSVHEPEGELSPGAFELEAETLRALAHPKRLLMLHLLGSGGMSVSALASALDLSLPNASQHLRVLRDRGLVRAERVGHGVRYRLANPTFLRCCARVREVLVEEVQRRSDAFHALGRDPSGSHAVVEETAT